MISQESPTLAESRNLHADKIVLCGRNRNSVAHSLHSSTSLFLCRMETAERRKEETEGREEDYNEEEEGCVALLATKGRGGEAEGIQVKLIIFIKAFFLQSPSTLFYF